MFMFLLLSLSLAATGATQKLQVKIKDMASDDGHILYILFKGDEGFPDDPSKSVRQGKVSTKEAKEGFFLSDLEAGDYALSVIHDENDNDKLDTNFLGIPKEGVGFSNNPKLYFGAPSFEKCQFTLEKDKTIEIKLKHF